MKATRVLASIIRTFVYLDQDTFRLLYKSMVRPNLEFAQEVRAPRYQKDIDDLEKMQRRATKMVPSLRGLSYQQRL
jgi:hypothetical protein